MNIRGWGLRGLLLRSVVILGVIEIFKIVLVLFIWLFITFKDFGNSLFGVGCFVGLENYFSFLRV